MDPDLFRKIILTLILVTSLSKFSLAEIILSFDIALFEPTQNVLTSWFGTNGTEVRLDFQNETMHESIIFRLKDQAVLKIDHKNKTYQEINLSPVEGPVSEEDEAQEALSKMIAKDDIDLQQMAQEKQRPKNLNGLKTKKVRIGVNLDRWVCNKYAVYLRMEKRKVLWTTTWGQLGVMPQQLGAFTKFYPILSQLVSRELFHTIEALNVNFSTQKYSGYPIKTFGYKDGALAYKSKLTDIIITKQNNPYYIKPEQYTKI